MYLQVIICTIGFENMEPVKRFVIQKHTKAGEVHWDLMLETGKVLQTYRLQLPPEKLPQQTSVALKIFDHPVKFLTYQGSVNKGKGTVEIAETGTYQMLNANERRQELLLEGKFLKGKFILTHIEDDRWEFRLC